MNSTDREQMRSKKKHKEKQAILVVLSIPFKSGRFFIAGDNTNPTAKLIWFGQIFFRFSFL
jgi:hypothetical protein